MNILFRGPDKPVRVLVAEDSPTQAQRLRYLLEKNGFEVAVGINGRLALEQVPTFKPELIISDVNMPEMGGYELAWHAKADPALKGVPVILVTTMSDAEDVIRGLECGADSFVLKPYDDKYLLGRIHHLLHNRAEGDEDDDPDSPVEVRLNGERHYITADRRQILHLLLSTYDAATQRNKELAASQDELRTLNRRLDAANAEMVDTNRFLDSVIDNVPNALFVKSPDELRYLRFNRAAQEFIGYSEDEVRGKTDADLFPPEQAEGFERADREVLESKRTFETPEEPVQTRYRGLRTVHTRKVPVCDGENRPLFLLGISEDVTEAREREREILQLNAALELRANEVEASNRELDAFTASVSHDLRAPLRHIAGYADMLDEATRGALPADAQRYLGIIRRASSRMGELIDDLLDLARTGRSAMQKQPIDLGALVASCRHDLAIAAGKRRIEWHVGELPTVDGDASMLKQVFANLLDNAVKYTRQREVAQIEVGGRIGGDGQLTVQVRDNGVGFDMAHVDKLFGVFQRLHAGDEFEGTGIGLANVRRIVARHGGETWAESRPGEGATFYFSLPVAAGGQTATAAAVAQQSPFPQAASVSPPNEAQPGVDPRQGVADRRAPLSTERQDGLRFAEGLGVRGDAASAAQVAEAIAATWRETVAALTPVVGDRGVAALYQRSLYLTARVHIWLASAHAGFQAPIDLESLSAALAQQDPAEAATGGVAHLQAFRKLLTALIGASLTERLLRKIWAQSLNSPLGPQISP